MLGEFNPKIFTPSWFAAYDLIGQHEAENAVVEIIHRDVSIFGLDWFRLHVTRDRFSISTAQDAYFDRLIDLVLQTFDHLSHTPATTIGVNWGGHYSVESIDEWHEFGHFLAPQKPWSNIFDDSGLLKVEIVEKQTKKDFTKGSIQVRVEPSRQIKQGISINLNDQYDIENKEKVIGCNEIISLLEINRKESRKKYFNLIENLFKNFEERNQ